MSVTKYIVDGKVAVLISKGYGAGWSTWEAKCEKEVLFDKDIVLAVLADDIEAVKNICENKYPNFYTGGIHGLTVVWLDVGTRFRVNEYDGAESIEIHSCANYIVA